MATNEIMFSELALGDVFSVVTYRKELKDKLFIKIIRSNGKYGAIPLADYKRISALSSTVINGNYQLETDCAHWHCLKETTPEKETKLIGLCDVDNNKIKMFRVTAEQLKVIYYMYNGGWLDCDEIIENPLSEITDLTE